MNSNISTDLGTDCLIINKNGDSEHKLRSTNDTIQFRFENISYTRNSLYLLRKSTSLPYLQGIYNPIITTVNKSQTISSSNPTMNQTIKPITELTKINKKSKTRVFILSTYRWFVNLKNQFLLTFSIFTKWNFMYGLFNWNIVYVMFPFFKI